MFISYMQAKNEGNKQQEEFLFNRFRPEMKKAVDVKPALCQVLG